MRVQILDRAIRPALGAICLLLCATAAIAIAAAPVAGAPSVSAALELSYGDGPGQVGVLEKGALHPDSMEVYPAMCQMTGDGSIWVLDTVNARVLEFRNGEQVSCISTASFQKRPHHFGVTRSAVFLVNGCRRDDVPAAASSFQILTSSRS